MASSHPQPTSSMATQNGSTGSTTQAVEENPAGTSPACKLGVVSTKIKKQTKKCLQKRPEVQCRRKKVNTVEQVLNDLQKQNLITYDQASMFTWCNMISVEGLTTGYIENVSMGCVISTEYTDDLQSFAMYLYFYSPEAYQYLRQTYETCLPQELVVQNWFLTENSGPGFTSVSLNALKVKADSTNQKIICALIMDEMSMQRSDGEYEDIGTPMDGGDCLPQVREALVFLVNAINGAWKVPVGFFLVDNVTQKQKANLVTQCLEHIHNTGVEIVSLTTDGCPTNFSMANTLGCSLKGTQMKTSFEHPTTKQPVYMVFDTCHMLEKVRLCMQANGVLKDSCGRLIKWSFLDRLDKLQKKENLHLAYKVLFPNNKARVRAATQLFSHSVADALTFYAEKDSNFKDVEGTVTFLRNINNLYDVLNSTALSQLELKKPISINNKQEIFNFLDHIKDYIKTLKRNDGSNLLKTDKFISGFNGFFVNIDSLKGLYERLVEQEAKLQHLPAYRLSRVHLEIMFGPTLGRAHRGCMSNPVASQFAAIYDNLLVKSTLNKRKASLKSIEEKSLLNCKSPADKINETTDRLQLWDDPEFNHRSRMELKKVDKEITLHVKDITEMNDVVITSLSEFVVQALIGKLKCEICLSALIAREKVGFDKFIKLESKINPSDDVIAICKETEGTVKIAALMQLDIIKEKGKLVTETLALFIARKVFDGIGFHQFEQSPMENHVVELIKAVVDKYVELRSHSLMKNKQPRAPFNKTVKRLKLF